jgi:erythromycin esterase
MIAKSKITIALSLILFLFSSMARAQNTTTINYCLGDAVYNIQSTTDTNYNDLEFLKPLVSDKRMVLLGESAHGVGDYYLLKTRLVEFLHQECGFEVLAFESGIADVFTEYARIESRTALELRDETIFSNLACNEITPLFEYIKNTSTDRHPLNFCGFDSQNFTASLAFLKTALEPTFGNKADSLIEVLNKYYNIPPLLWQQDKTPLFQISDSIIQAATALKVMLQSEQFAIMRAFNIDTTFIKVLERSLQNHIEAVSINWYTQNPSAKRDSLMAENLIWLMNEIYPDKKIIVWAHNTHIDKGSITTYQSKNLGYYLNEAFPNKTYHIGLYAKTGLAYSWWEKDTRSFNNNDTTDIEQILDVYPISFLNVAAIPSNCNWIYGTVNGLEFEFGRKIPFTPAIRYDAIINLRDVKASTY